MWQIILGVYLVISALVGLLLWLAMIIARRSDERTMRDFTESADEADQ